MKIKIIGIVALMMLLNFSLVLAENETSDVSTGDSVVPTLISAPENDSIDLDEDDNQTVSDVQIFWKKVDIAFTFNQEKKAEKEMKLAELELIRAKIAAKNNNSQAMIKALEAHQTLIALVQNRVSKIDEKKNVTDKVVGIDRAIQAHEAKIARLNNIIANNTNLTTEEIARIQENIAITQNNTQHLKEVAEAKLDKLELRRTAMNAEGDDIQKRIQNKTHVNYENNSEMVNGSGMNNDFEMKDNFGMPDVPGKVKIN